MSDIPELSERLSKNHLKIEVKMALKEEILELLKKPDVVNDHGIECYEIANQIGCTESELSAIIKELKNEGLIVAISFRHSGEWDLRYYSSPRNETPIHNRIEEIFTELAIPLWVKTRVFRGAKVIFVGESGKEPGFTIIDYSEDPPLIFNDKLAGGNANEIVDYKRRSKYKCEKDGKIVWYSYKGQKVQIQ